MTPKLQLAFDFMRAAHRSIDQKRKDDIRPYEVHPEDVFKRVSEVSDDEDVLVAALFHDIIEDVYPLRPEVYEATREFAGARAWGFILELTDKFTKKAHPDKNRKTRKQLERERYGAMSREARIVKLADIASNLEDDGDVLEGGKPEAGFHGMFIREKALCLPYLTFDADKDAVIRQMGAKAEAILERQADKFGVRLGAPKYRVNTGDGVKYLNEKEKETLLDEIFKPLE